MAQMPCSKTEVLLPVISHELASRGIISSVEPDLKRCWFVKVYLQICWVVVQKSACSQEKLHLVHRRNQRKEEMHGERVRVRTVILTLWRQKVKLRNPPISLTFFPSSALDQPLSKGFYLTLLREFCSMSHTEVFQMIWT